MSCAKAFRTMCGDWQTRVPQPLLTMEAKWPIKVLVNINSNASMLAAVQAEKQSAETRRAAQPGKGMRLPFTGNGK